ncbi:MAG: CRISPR-associated endonuclease Cas1, partial [Acidimicrobiaceae bacterium]|nr:CRISPR-associated endonuclease Cas1 [Acidimicrobiaceae bacterium]
RPRVDSYVLELLSRRHFRATDFHETREGACRLMPVLAHELAETATTWATAVAPFAEQIAHQLSAGTGRAARSTPLTQANRKAAQGKPSFAVRRPRGELPPVAALAVTCRTCGAELPDKRRKLCATCWPVTRARLATERAAAGRAASAQRRALGEDPSNTEAARVARAVALSARKREQLEWESATPGLVAINFEEVLQGLSSVPLSRMREATGLSVSACSRIRSGALRPHPRHWAALSGLASQRGVQMDRAPFVDQAE